MENGVVYDAAAAAAAQIVNLYMQESSTPKAVLFGNVLFIVKAAIEAADVWRRDSYFKPSSN